MTNLNAARSLVCCASVHGGEALDLALEVYVDAAIAARRTALGEVAFEQNAVAVALTVDDIHAGDTLEALFDVVTRHNETIPAGMVLKVVTGIVDSDGEIHVVSDELGGSWIKTEDIALFKIAG